MHDAAENCAMFQMKVKTGINDCTAVATTKANMKKLINKDPASRNIADTVEKATADELLYAIICRQIKLPSLAMTLMQRYEDLGGDAYWYR